MTQLTFWLPALGMAGYGGLVLGVLALDERRRARAARRRPRPVAAAPTTMPAASGYAYSG